MGELIIKEAYGWQYKISSSAVYEDIYSCKTRYCYYCGIGLNKIYSYIIDCLKEAELLIENYEQMCCYCNVLSKVGLIDLRNFLGRVNYIIETDLLVLIFNYTAYTIEFRIHNFRELVFK